MKNDQQVKLLAQDFKDYKNGVIPNYPLFGRDVAFTDNPHLANSNIHKVHLIAEGEYNKKQPQHKNTSDLAHLVYCSHIEDPTQLCVIDFLSPGAHNKARNSGKVVRMVDRAEFFMKSYKITKSA
jgi:mRNA interferase YafO